MPKLTLPSPRLYLSVAGANPAAGAEWFQAVPADKAWRLQSINVQLVTDATVATRTMRIIIDDGANTLFLLAAIDNQVASLTYNYECAVFGYQPAIHAPAGLASSAYIPLPDNLWLPANARVRSSTLNMVAGDNYSAPRFLVEEVGYP